MSWIYHQYSGELTHNGLLIDRGYSGKGVNRNNPAAESVKHSGPIPRGRYDIRGYTH